ncbi:MAG: hypothetical protein HY069_04230 [Chlamydiia bacterium]|nr:hypothetical protein [Chlamydiia bacterium]
MTVLLVRLGICIGVVGCCLFSYIQAQNQLTHLKIQLPQIEKEIQILREESSRLSYEIGQFESPNHLMDLARRPEYSHLKHPVLKEVLTVPEVWATNEP